MPYADDPPAKAGKASATQHYRTGSYTYRNCAVARTARPEFKFVAFTPLFCHLRYAGCRTGCKLSQCHVFRPPMLQNQRSGSVGMHSVLVV